MKKNKISQETRIGIAVVIAIVILFFGFNYLKGINILKPSNYYYAKINNVSGLTVSSPVYVNGFKVGQIHDIKFNSYKPSEIILELALNKNYKLPQSSKAYITIELVGTAFVKLEFNDNDKNFLNPGDTIAAFRNNNFAEQATNELLPQLQQTLPRIDSVLVALQKVLENPTIVNALTSLESTTRQLEIASFELNSILKKDLSVMLNNINTITSDVGVFTGDLKQVKLSHTIDQTNLILDNLQLTTTRLNNPDNSLNKLLNDDHLYNTLSLTLENTNRLLVDIREHPKRYVHFSIFGKKDK